MGVDRVFLKLSEKTIPASALSLQLPIIDQQVNPKGKLRWLVKAQ
jgi:hypothetical protein